jgi:RimJ/RimL family protein N-acetyltransferase
MHSPRTVMEWQAATLFRYDANGRLRATNEPGDPPAPRVFIGRTVEGNLWRFRHDLPDTLVRDLDRMLAAEPTLTNLRQPLRCFDRLQDALAAHAPIAGMYEGPAWWCPEGIVVPRAVPVTRLTDATAAARTFPWLADELPFVEPCMAVLHDGEAVALCFSSRLSPVAAEAGVETLAPYQRRGYAAAVVAAWAGAVRALGCLPLYSTSWDNLASQGVAASLGLVLYGADVSFM